MSLRRKIQLIRTLVQAQSALNRAISAVLEEFGDDSSGDPPSRPTVPSVGKHISPTYKIPSIPGPEFEKYVRKAIVEIRDQKDKDRIRDIIRGGAEQRLLDDAAIERLLSVLDNAPG